MITEIQETVSRCLAALGSQCVLSEGWRLEADSVGVVLVTISTDLQAEVASVSLRFDPETVASARIDIPALEISRSLAQLRREVQRRRPSPSKRARKGGKER